MAHIKVVEVESAAQHKAFITYPNKLYRDDKNYVTPLYSERKEFLDLKKNPFYRTAKVKLFLAMDGATVVGRIATCINYTHNEVHSEQVGFFGFFDCPDDFEIASVLLKVAMITLKKEKMEKMRGPADFSTNHECGFLVEGFDSPPVVMMTYNQPYLPRLAEKFGLKKSMDLLAYHSPPDMEMPERFVKIVDRMSKRSQVTLRSIRMNDFDNEVSSINKIYQKAWEANWGFVPMQEDEFFYMAKNLKQIIEPDLVLIAEHDGIPVGFSMAVPDVNQALIHLKGKLFPLGLPKLLWHTKVRNKIDTIRIVTLGVMPEYRKRGVDAMMYVETYKRGLRLGYKAAEASWILEVNELMRIALEQMGFSAYKRYRLVEMPL